MSNNVNPDVFEKMLEKHTAQYAAKEYPMAKNNGEKSWILRIALVATFSFTSWVALGLVTLSTEVAALQVEVRKDCEKFEAADKRILEVQKVIQEGVKEVHDEVGLVKETVIRIESKLP